MTRILAAAGLVLCLAIPAAQAQERVGDAALGAGAGALVLGPVGAAAGALIGYTAGPAIARSWGIGGPRYYYARRQHKAAVRRTAATDKPATKSAKRGGWYNVIRN